MSMRITPGAFFAAAFVLLAFMLAGGNAARAQDTPPRFFSAVHDLPLMPGLREMEDQTLSFDVSAGRIIETAADLSGVAPARVDAFYQGTLPQLGWRAAGPLRFVRGKEVLELSFEERPQGKMYLKVRLAPSS